MKRTLLPGLILLSLCARPLTSAESIGFAYVEGSYRVNGATVRGNATLFEGTVLETGDAPAKLQLKGGRRLWLTPGSQASVFERSVVLAKGLGQYEGPVGSGLEAGAIRVVASVPDTVVRVALEKGSAAVVSPSRGAVEVVNGQGLRVGNLSPGSTVRFAEQQDAAAAVQISGCVRRDGNGLAVTDRITNVSMRIKGSGLEAEVGQFVQIAGVNEQSRAGSRATEVAVRQIKRVSQQACTPEILGRAAPLLAMARLSPTEQLARSTPVALSLVVVEGEGAINNIRQRTAREPVVQVEDENRRPVAGALVLFALPRSGASGTFENGATTLRVTTDQQGRAVARGLRPNNQAGQFQIAVTASLGPLTATIAITQANAMAPPSGAGSSDATTGATSGGAAAGGAGGGGIGTGATVAIIGGVSASAVVGGLAAGGVIFGGGAAEAPASR